MSQTLTLYKCGFLSDIKHNIAYVFLGSSGCVIKTLRWPRQLSDLWTQERMLRISRCPPTQYKMKIYHVAQEMPILPFFLSTPTSFSHQEGTTICDLGLHTAPHISPNLKPAGNDFTQSGHPQAEPTISLYGWSGSLLLSVSRLPAAQKIRDVLVRHIPHLLYHCTACN